MNCLGNSNINWTARKYINSTSKLALCSGLIVFSTCMHRLHLQFNVIHIDRYGFIALHARPGINTVIRCVLLLKFHSCLAGRKDLNDHIMKEQRNVQHTGTSNGRDWFLTVYNLSGVHSKKGKRGGTHWYPASRSSGVRRRDLVLGENGVHIGIFLVWLMTSMCHNKVYR